MAAGERSAAAGGPYDAPTRFCDVVMKGGITSGIVYPLAVCELARAYTFRNIGGTSAGAIAAAATAAAELGRTRSPGGGFPALERLPADLGADVGGGQTRLRALFQPQPATRPLFALFAAAAGDGRGRWRKLLAAALAGFPVAALLGALPGLVLLAVLVARSADPVLLAVGLPVALVLALAGALLAVSVAAVRRAATALPENFYGLCTGAETEGGAAGRAEPLTVWLDGLLRALAHQPDRGRPLTFADLWGPEGVAGGERRINLEMVTTCLTLGRPFRLPFRPEDGEGQFFFDPGELARLFPPDVVRWLVDHPGPQGAQLPQGSPLHPLPAMADLPVVVAVRMSLSFPLLLSAVPLYAIDRSCPRERQTPERCWFSDGGITSNFPVHFFDAPLPRWPTFGINLRSFHRCYPPNPYDEARNIWMPRRNAAGILPAWTVFDDRPGLWGRLGGFVGVILDTLQNWADNAQARVPGYRDRVVHIFVEDDLGGLNVNMDESAIARLSRRGGLAGAELVRRFTAPPGGPPDGPEMRLTWDNHRWVRFRTLMDLLEDLLLSVAARYDGRYPGQPPGERTYAELLRRDRDDPPLSYRLDPGQRAEALAAMERLEALAGDLQDHPFGKGAPRPRPALRPTPRL